MPNFSAIVLLTRPEEAAHRFAAELAEDLTPRAHVVVSPLLDIAPVDAEVDLSRYAGVIFTSARALPFAGPPQGLPAYCVGAATRKAAQAQGWPVRCDAQDADHLYAALLEQKIPVPLVHLAGQHRRGALAERLTAAGLPTDVCTLYTQKSRDLSPAARAALAGTVPVIVPLFSPRTAQIFADQHTGSAPLYLVAMSEAALAPAQHLSTVETRIAPTPTALAIKHEIAHALRRVEARGTPL